MKSRSVLWRDPEIRFYKVLKSETSLIELFKNCIYTYTWNNFNNSPMCTSKLSTSSTILKHFIAPIQEDHPLHAGALTQEEGGPTAKGMEMAAQDAVAGKETGMEGGSLHSHKAHSDNEPERGSPCRTRRSGTYSASR